MIRLTIILLICPLFLFSQKMEDITHRKVHVNTNDSLIIAHVITQQKDKTLKLESNYYSYYNNHIKTNQGDYNGKLLDGEYKVVDKHKNLITKGNIKHGLKSGKWKRWNHKGKLKNIYNWKKGLKNGSYALYENGKPSKKGSYRKGNLHGKQITYKDDTISNICKYKKGKLVEQKEKTKKVEVDNKKEIIKEVETKNKWWKFWAKKEEESKKKSKPKKKKKEAKLKNND